MRIALGKTVQHEGFNARYPKGRALVFTRTGFCYNSANYRLMLGFTVAGKINGYTNVYLPGTSWVLVIGPVFLVRLYNV